MTDLSGTIAGAAGGAPVTIPFSSSANAALAQGALNHISGLSSTSSAFQMDFPTVSGVASGSSGTGTFSGEYVSVPGYTSFPSLPGNNTALIVNGASTVSAIGSGLATTVIGSSDSSIVFLNNDTTSAPSQIFLGGGINYISENTSVSSAVVNVDGSTVSALDPVNARGGAYIDGSQGATTINLFNNALVELVTGGQNVVVANAGTEVLGLVGSSTIAPTISALSGSTLYISDEATSAFIAPGAGNVVLLFPASGTSGTATLFGGTGSDTVLGGSGYFQGGSAGNNTFVTSTLSGAATLVGGGNNDYLASFGNNDLLMAGAGSETLAAWSVTGDTLVGGSGADVIYGSFAAHNVIGFGSGDALAYGQHGAAGTAGNTFFQNVAGGVDTIGDFLPGTDVFSLSLSSTAEGGGSITVTSLQYYASAGSSPFGNVGTQATLSDGSTVNFIHANVTKSCFT